MPEEAEVHEWAIVEVYGHRKHAGRIFEHERFGTKMLRIDVPSIKVESGEAGPVFITQDWTTHYYGGASIFSLTPTDEETAMRANRPYAPAGRYTLPAPDYDDLPDDDEKPF